MTTIKPLLTPQAVAELLGVSVNTLAVWRCTGRYPLPYRKVGRKVRYEPSEVEAFIAWTSRSQTLPDARNS